MVTCGMSLHILAGIIPRFLALNSSRFEMVCEHLQLIPALYSRNMRPHVYRPVYAAYTDEAIAIDAGFMSISCTNDMMSANSVVGLLFWRTSWTTTKDISACFVSCL